MADNVLVGIPEIAELAGVTRAAVSNWRKRHNDFPEPRVQTESGVLFDLASVEDWLLERDKLDGPVPAGPLVWRFADALRGAWSADEFADFLTSWIVYLEACGRPVPSSGTSGGPGRANPLDVPPQYTWATVQRSLDEDLSDRIALAAGEIEARNPVLDGLLSGLAPDPFPDVGRLRAFVAQLEGAANREGGRVTLLDKAQERVQALDRFAGGFDTPESVGYLMSRLAGSITGAGTVIDPAVGTGRLLLWWAIAETRPTGPVDLLGIELNDAVSRDARARFFVSEVEADIRCADSLRLHPSELPAADIILLDPPMNVANWGDAALYRDARWTFGAPPAGNANLAWVQLCVSMLKPTGRAVVSLPAGSLTSAGVEARIRQGLVDAGAVEAIIELPARLRRDTSVPVALWLLRKAPASRASAKELLLVDASRLGTSSRSEHDLDYDDIDRVLEAVDGWRRGDDLPADRPSLDGTEPFDRLMCLTIDTANVVDGDLSPRRYEPIPSAKVDELRAVSDSLFAELDDDLRKFNKVIRQVLELSTTHDGPSTGSQSSARSEPEPLPTGTPRARLGDIADVRTVNLGDSDASDALITGDLFIRATTRGFVVDTVSPRRTGDDPGGRALGIHLRDEQPPEMRAWIRLWSKSSEFLARLERHATGTALKSVSAKAVEDFPIPVPNLAHMRRAANRTERVADATDLALFVHETLRDLYEAECKLVFVETVGE